MSLTLYDISVTPFIRNLKTLSKLLAKGQAHVGAANEGKLLESRLVEDMQPLAYQIQRLSDTAKGLAVRVGKAENVAWEDNEKTFPDLYERINKTVVYLEKLDRKSFDGLEEAEIIMKRASGDKTFTGSSYVNGYAVPNFYFHFVTAYALLRKEGVPIGKTDYLGAA